jgi:hypothetical protein
MRKLLISIFFITCSVYGQTGFVLNQSIPVDRSGPVELAWSGGLNFPMFSEIDFNNDGRKDLFVFDRSNNRVLTFINNGGSGTHCWEYAPQYEKYFPVMQGWAFLYDYNCDGKPDIFTVNYFNNGIFQYRNDSQGSGLQFTLVDSSIQYDFGGPILSNILASGNLVPDFNDIDGDGDMDIIGQQFQCAGGFAYYKNMSMEDYGVCDSLDDYVLVTNVWGAFTLRAGLYTSVAVGNWNVSCFATGNNGGYEVTRRDDTFASLRTLDIDGDGDMDILIGDSQADNSLLVVNGGTPTNAHMVSQDTLFPSYDVPVNLHSFTAHAYIDADNDGIKDLVVSQSEYDNNHGIYFYKNTGTNAIPTFNFQQNDFFQGEMIDVGESATPVLFDFDADGLQDLVIGNKQKTTGNTTYTTGLALYKNTGTLAAPAFEFVTDDYAGIESQLLTGQIFPAFADLDGDNDLDMVLGLDDGRFNYYENTAGPGVPAVFAAPVFYYMSIDVGQAATPQLIDFDRDGLTDIITGNKNGLVKYFRNLGSASVPFFSSTPTIDTLGGINVQSYGYPDGYSVPFVYEQHGLYRMLVSCMKGDIYLYGNINGNLNGTYTPLDTVFSKAGGYRSSYNLSVSGGDLNNDTLIDMLVGFYGGGVQVFYQDDNINSVSKGPGMEGLRISPNPAGDYVVVKSNFRGAGQRYRLYDLNGRLLSSEPMPDHYSIIDTHELKAGIYLIRIFSEAGVASGKLVIQR